MKRKSHSGAKLLRKSHPRTRIEYETLNRQLFQAAKNCAANNQVECVDLLEVTLQACQEMIDAKLGVLPVCTGKSA